MRKQHILDSFTCVSAHVVHLSNKISLEIQVESYVRYCLIRQLNLSMKKFLNLLEKYYDRFVQPIMSQSH